MTPSPTTVSTVATAYTQEIGSRVMQSLMNRIDKGLVRYDAWFLIFTAVIIGLGVSLLAGLALWCVIYKERTFTGNWAYASGGLKVYIECK